MGKIYTALGLMSGTSLDGVDVSIIKSDGHNEYSSIIDRYFKYDDELVQKILKTREKIFNIEDLLNYSAEIKALEREITLFHADVVNKTFKMSESTVDLIGFHGQTIFHNPAKRLSKQLGDGNLLSQLTKKKVIYDFRKNDVENGGQGAPLAPIFHNVIANSINKKFKLQFPINILNIGGIANITKTVDEKKLWKKDKIYAYDIGPGNCLIDEWVRKNSKKTFDIKGSLARTGKIDKLILNQALENFSFSHNYEKSLDIKDFDIFFAKGLSLEDGAATVTSFTAKLISEGINFINHKDKNLRNNWLVCGGGRKNEYLIERIKENFKDLQINPIEIYGIDGDFIESQAFAYLAIRSIQGLPISFPSTTRCKDFLTGGILAENY